MVAHKKPTIIWLDTVDSTNSWLSSHAYELENGAICASLNQTAGRGRRGRTWNGQPGEMLAISILQKQLLPSSITLVAGLAVAKALEKVGGKSVQLKWPNDILVDKRKCAGILCESSICGERMSTIIGIGINLGQSREQFEAQGLPYAISLKEAFGKEPCAEELAEAIAIEWQQMWSQYQDIQFEGFKDTYIEKCVTIGSEVNVITGEESAKGRAVSITDDGTLMVESENGLLECRAGEVSIRGIYGYGE